jgi:hypothetical protein
MKDDAAQRADEPQHERREPTFGEIREPPPREAPAAARARPDRIDADARVLDGFSLGLARGESIIDNAETSAGAGLSRLVLTDRRLIVLGRDHQTVYPLRGVTRLAVVRYLRWGWAVLGLALALAGAIAALVPTPFLPAGREEVVYVSGAVFVAGLLLAALGMLRPVRYVEITTTAGELKLAMKRKDEALANFLNSLAQQIR